MLDVRCGRIAYAVLASSGFPGIGGKLLAIPWRTLTLDRSRERFAVGIVRADQECTGIRQE